MKMIPMKCPSCGSNVEVDAYSKQYTCNVCGTTTLIEKEKEHYDSYHDESLFKIDRLLEEKKYKDAIDKFDYMTETYSDDPRVWLGLIRAYTHDLQAKIYIDCSPYEPVWLSGFEQILMDTYRKYLITETKENEKTNVSNIFTKYINDNKNEYQELLNKNKEVKDVIDIVGNDSNNKSIYNDTIKAENKIIKSEDILEIVKTMQARIDKYNLISQKEEQRNDQYSYRMHESTFKDNGSKLTFSIDFLDNTEVKIDNTEEFIYLYETRLSEIKYIYVYFNLSYGVETIIPKRESDFKSQSITLHIYQYKIDIDVKLISDDDKISDIYGMIKKMVLSAPPKYDDIVRKRTSICLLTSIGCGMIPSAIICALLCISPLLRQVFAESIILIPVLGLLIAFVLGEIIQTFILGPLYEPIKPEQKYAGWKDGQSIHVDDVEDYTKTSEILIGKNVNNLEHRKKIRQIYNTSLKLMIGGFIVIILITAIVVLLGNN